MLSDDYELEETIAKSVRTVVQRARRKADGLRVVIKSLAQAYPSASAVGQMEFEYRILRRLSSPGVIGAVDLARDEHRVAIVLEDFGGQRLPPHSARDGQLGAFSRSRSRRPRRWATSTLRASFTRTSSPGTCCSTPPRARSS